MPALHSFPTRRSSDLLVEKDVRELVAERIAIFLGGEVAALASPLRDRAHDASDELAHRGLAAGRVEMPAEVLRDDDVRDRKSTRLNSSHGYISYAVYC